MKCAVINSEQKTCTTCGFKTAEALIMVCPRCASALPRPASCGGGCSGCARAK